MSEPNALSFGGDAGGALAPVAGQVEQVKEQALAGTLHIDLDAAQVILAQLGALRLRAADLLRDCAELDTPLKFGRNWVGQIVAARLHAVAAGPADAVAPVLTAFHQVLDDL